MINTLVLTIYKDGDGFRTTASGTKDFDENWKEFGRSHAESIGWQLKSLYEQGFLSDPVMIRIVDSSNIQLTN